MTEQWTDDEQAEEIDPRADLQQVVQSITESLRAMVTMQSRLDSAHDPTLQGILAQQLSREKEHLVMLLEWMRQKDPTLDEHMRAYLFQRDETPEAAPAPAPEPPAPPPVVLPPEPAPLTTPAKGTPLTINPNMRIRG